MLLVVGAVALRLSRRRGGPRPPSGAVRRGGAPNIKDFPYLIVDYFFPTRANREGADWLRPRAGAAPIRSALADSGGEIAARFPPPISRKAYLEQFNAPPL